MTHFVEEFKKELQQETQRILSFWIEKIIDEKKGGFYGEVDNSGVSVEYAHKGVVLNTRILWTFSAAYGFFKREEYLEKAHRAYDFLIKYFWDQKYDGLYWSLNSYGQVIDDRKQIYAQGFGIYAFSEYYKVTGTPESLDFAIKLYHNIETYSYDHESHGYLEALSRKWEKVGDMRLSEKDENEPKSMNTHLHLLEAYTNLYKVWKDDRLAAQTERLLRVFLDQIIDPKTAHFQLFFEMNWEVKSTMVSYGHDIEGAWLLCEAAGIIGNGELQRVVNAVSLRLADAAIRDGMASDGSLYYEKDMTTGHLDSDRHWWVQAEAMVGLMNAWQISGNTVYKERMFKIWQYIKNHIIDNREGEWFSRINQDGQPVLSDPKAGFWKCPYHNSRALMEIFQRVTEEEKSS